MVVGAGGLVEVIGELVGVVPVGDLALGQLGGVVAAWQVAVLEAV